MDEQTILANLEQRLALEIGRQSMMRMRAEVERDLAHQVLAQQAAEAKSATAEAEPDAPSAS